MEEELVLKKKTHKSIPSFFFQVNPRRVRFSFFAFALKGLWNISNWLAGLTRKRMKERTKGRRQIQKTGNKWIFIRFYFITVRKKGFSSFSFSRLLTTFTHFSFNNINIYNDDNNSDIWLIFYRKNSSNCFSSMLLHYFFFILFQFRSGKVKIRNASWSGRIRRSDNIFLGHRRFHYDIRTFDAISSCRFVKWSLHVFRCNNKCL